MQRSRIRPVVVGLALAAMAVTVPSAAIAGTAGAADPQLESGSALGCERQLEEALRLDMESFRDFDADTFRAGHDERAITVFPSGFVANGIDATMAALAPHFANRNAVWTWTETHRIVDGCKSAVVVYDARYDIPSQGFFQHQIVTVTWIYENGSWLAVADVNTLLR